MLKEPKPGFRSHAVHTPHPECPGTFLRQPLLQKGALETENGAASKQFGNKRGKSSAVSLQVDELRLEPEGHADTPRFTPKVSLRSSGSSYIEISWRVPAEASSSIQSQKKVILVKKSKLELFPLMGEGQSHSDLVPKPTGGSLYITCNSLHSSENFSLGSLTGFVKIEHLKKKKKNSP